MRPQHLQRYREYATIYKEEEEERSERWKHFLESYVSSAQLSTSDSLSNEQMQSSVPSLHDADPNAATKIEDFTGSVERISPDKLSKIDDVKQDKENHKTKTWSHIRASLDAIGQNPSFRIRKRRIASVINKDANSGSKIPSVEEPRLLKASNLVSEEDSEEEFYDVERSDLFQDASSNDSRVGDSDANYASPHGSYAGSCAWKEELESLVHGGVPMALRKELWQAFVGTQTQGYRTIITSYLCLEEMKGLTEQKLVIF